MTFCVGLMDHVLGWSLHLPRFAVLALLAVCTAAVLTGVRKFTTNQNLLGRAKADKARLKELLRAAKVAGDKEAVKRYRATIGEIGAVGMKAELLPLAASLIPIALLATWAFSRIWYEAPRGAEPVVIKAYFATDKIGDLVHMVPQPGLEAKDGWIQKIGEDKDDKGNFTSGIATWQVRATAGGGSFVLPIRYKGQTFEKALLIDGYKYAEPVQVYETADHKKADCEAIQLAMPEYRPLGFVPGFSKIGLPPWIIGYLILVIPLSFLLKPALRIY